MENINLLYPPDALLHKALSPSNTRADFATAHKTRSKINSAINILINANTNSYGAANLNLLSKPFGQALRLSIIVHQIKRFYGFIDLRYMKDVDNDDDEDDEEKRFLLILYLFVWLGVRLAWLLSDNTA
uniref:Uncharacterized protein n=1 Tax=Glossina pallidipes TaxID=7398 RepID=A0A1A9ZNB9_GLOPL